MDYKNEYRGNEYYGSSLNGKRDTGDSLNKFINVRNRTNNSTQKNTGHLILQNQNICKYLKHRKLI